VEARTAVDEEQDLITVFPASGQFEDIDFGADVIDTVPKVEGKKIEC
jgi:hypothetical protein